MSSFYVPPSDDEDYDDDDGEFLLFAPNGQPIRPTQNVQLDVQTGGQYTSLTPVPSTSNANSNCNTVSILSTK